MPAQKGFDDSYRCPASGRERLRVVLRCENKFVSINNRLRLNLMRDGPAYAVTPHHW